MNQSNSTTAVNPVSHSPEASAARTNVRATQDKPGLIITISWQTQQVVVHRGVSDIKFYRLTPKMQKALSFNDRYISHPIYDGRGKCGVELTPKTHKQLLADKRKQARKLARMAMGAHSTPRGAQWQVTRGQGLTMRSLRQLVEGGAR